MMMMVMMMMMMMMMMMIESLTLADEAVGMLRMSTNLKEKFKVKTLSES